MRRRSQGARARRFAGIDVPFGKVRRFVNDVGWPFVWKDNIGHVERSGKAALDKNRKTQPEGEKEHLRRTGVLARAQCPQKLASPRSQRYSSKARRGSSRPVEPQSLDGGAGGPFVSLKNSAFVIV